MFRLSCISLLLVLAMYIMPMDAHTLQVRDDAGLFPTLWPADHANNGRQKFVQEGGLPADVSSEELKVVEAALPYPQWLYTREEDELFVYGGPNAGRYFAKLHARTLEVLQKIDLEKCVYFGGALVHASGDVYFIHKNVLYRFIEGDLDNAIVEPLPSLNGNVTQVNGLMTFPDGRILVKQWTQNYIEAWFFASVVPPLMLACLLPALLFTLLAFCWFKPKQQHLWLPWSLGTVLIATFLLQGTFYGVVTLFSGTFDFFPFFFPSQETTAAFRIIDPLSLRVLSTTYMDERHSYPRLAIEEQVQDGKKTSFVFSLGDEHITKWRYDPGEEGSQSPRLEKEEAWAARYRRWGDGSWPGTGPSLLNGTLFFTDNTYPVFLTNGYRMYQKSTKASEDQDGDQDGDLYQTWIRTKEEGPGFMYWSVTGNPGNDGVVVWDIGNAQVQGRSSKNISILQWEAPALNTDCLSVSVKSNHVDASDYDIRIPTNLHMDYAGMLGTTRKMKSLVVLNATDGSEVARKELGEGKVYPSMLIPGFHNDVYVGLTDQLVRVYADRPSSEEAKA